MADNRKKTEAEARFAKAQKRSIDAAKAMSEAEAEARRVDANTQRLRALRLARDAAEESAAAKSPPSQKNARAKKSSNKKTAANTAEMEARRLAGNAADAIVGKKRRRTKTRRAKSIPVEHLNASNDK
jgi:hypothetical protein